MRVDFSEWHTQPGLVARQYIYSQMGGTRDTELQVHFDIQAGLSVYTFVSFLMSDLDLPQEMALRGSLEPMDRSTPKITLSMMGRPDGKGGAVMSVFSREDQSKCLGMFLKGKQMHFEVGTTEDEPLIKLPIPNDAVFQRVFQSAYDQVRRTDDAQNPDGILGKINRFFR